MPWVPVYDWAQAEGEILVEAAVPRGVADGDVAVVLTRNTLQVRVQQQTVVDGRLGGIIVPQQSSWRLMPGVRGAML